MLLAAPHHGAQCKFGLTANLHPMHVPGMSKLDDYLTSIGTTNAEFGRLVGASEATISRLRHGKQDPSFALARRIKQATAGHLTADDLMTPPIAAPSITNEVSP